MTRNTTILTQHSTIRMKALRRQDLRDLKRVRRQHDDDSQNNETPSNKLLRRRVVVYYPMHVYMN